MTIQLASLHDVNPIIDLIQKRIQWMDELGIDQWNNSGYLQTFTLEYFEKVIINQNLYKVLGEQERLVGAFTLFEEDARWTDNAVALYIHNFVSQIDIKGVGDKIISFCESEARNRGISKLRVDCKNTNLKLNQYYQNRGFEYISSFEEEKYSGNRREKTIEQ